MPGFAESVVEEAALAWLESVGWLIRNGAEIAPGEPAAGRDALRPKLVSGERCVKDAGNSIELATS
jgi:hypothetical protein